MNEELVNINKELNDLSEEVASVEDDKGKLMNTEEELDFIFSKNKRLFQKLKYELDSGTMNVFIHDAEEELNHYKRKSMHTVEDEIHSLNRKRYLLEEKEEELQQKKRWLSSRTTGNKNTSN